MGDTPCALSAGCGRWTEVLEGGKLVEPILGRARVLPYQEGQQRVWHRGWCHFLRCRRKMDQGQLRRRSKGQLGRRSFESAGGPKEGSSGEPVCALRHCHTFTIKTL